MPSIFTPEQRSAYQRDGYVMVRSLFDPGDARADVAGPTKRFVQFTTYHGGVWGTNAVWGSHAVWGTGTTQGFSAVWGAHAVWGSSSFDSPENVSVNGEN